MGRELQKRKRRSSRPAVKQHSSSRSSSKLLNPLGNNTVAKNWDKKLTTTQNYRALGLVSRLKAPTGGVEPNQRSRQAYGKGRSTKPTNPFAIDSTNNNSVVTEARVERDADGKIIRIIGHGNGANSNPLNDPLNALDSDNSDMEDADPQEEEAAEEWGGFEGEEEENNKNSIVKLLEAEANQPREKKPRVQSTREREWLDELVAKHGEDNVRAMARDRKLNPMQQTEADIARRLRKMKKEEGN